MQRHFSNRGQAPAKVAVAKIMARRMPQVHSSERRSRITTEPWKTRIPEPTPATNQSAKTGESAMGSPDF